MTVPRLVSVFTDLVDADPDRVVLYDGQAGRAPARPVTRRELRDLAADMAVDLRAAGTRAGDCIAVWLPNWSQSVAVQLAAVLLGGLVFCVNTRYNILEGAHLFEG